MAPAAVEGLEGWSDPFGVGWCSGGAAALPDRAGSGCWRRWAVLSGGEAPVGEQGSMWTLVGLAGTLEQGGGLASRFAKLAWRLSLATHAGLDL
ncbi:hypothetical protein QQ045_023506 [Rhodiola kirilowii]